MQGLVEMLRQRYRGITLSVWETGDHIELAGIYVPKPMQNQGWGAATVKAIQDYANKVGKPVVLRPQPDRGKKAALERFYKRLGFVSNSGRHTDFTLGSPFARTMYWKPRSNK